MTRKKKQPLAGYALRLPADLKAVLEAKAYENENSLNREIVQRLKRSLEGWRQ